MSTMTQLDFALAVALGMVIASIIVEVLFTVVGGFLQGVQDDE